MKTGDLLVKVDQNAAATAVEELVDDLEQTSLVGGVEVVYVGHENERKKTSKHMDDVSENTRDDRHEPHRPTHSEHREWAKQNLKDGLDPAHYEEGPGTLPKFDGFADTLRETRDLFSGAFTAEEFAEVARDAFEAAIEGVLDDEETTLDEDAHRTLDSFEGYESRLTFDEDLIDKLLDGRKTTTVRYALPSMRVLPEDRLVLETPDGTPFAEATVEDVIRTDLSDALDAVEDEDYQHTAEGNVELALSLNEYYADPIGFSTEVAVVLLDDVTEVET